ncbi:MAG: hypothetical protein JST98_12085 [Bacteroidetes bacterium]|nr:hypothetical protein [Bacteroidota bacterium]MBS1945902.1 hypothetical protein [Bacteroidota bacterium]
MRARRYAPGWYADGPLALRCRVKREGQRPGIMRSPWQRHGLRMNEWVER